jgi:hypothetical protein
MVMLRTLQAFLVLGVWGVAAPAAAEEPPHEPASKDQQPAATGADEAATGEASEKLKLEASSDQPASKEQSPEPVVETAAEHPALAPSAEVTAVEPPSEGWQTSVSGYFRAPFALGISPRPGPDNLGGPAQTQISYGPTRTVDANYYSFAYTRLQEQDWAEFFIHEKKKHVEAVVGWMGYWYQSAAFRNPDAGWLPGMAYVVLDTDVEVAGRKPNVALTAGAFWPTFGAFAKYDTTTLGRFRHLGEQLKLTVPVNPDLTVTLTQGFGTGRDGSFNITVRPPYQAIVGLNLVHYENLQLTYKKFVDVGLHYNNQWTRDPNLTQQTTPGKAYSDAAAAYLTTIGGEVALSAPYAGRLWVSPSYVRVKNGWALGNAGTEVMHSIGGAGIAANYMAWTNNPPDSTGTGSMFNLGFLYENSLSGIQNKPKGSLPDVTLNVFGLLANVSLDLPAASVISQHLKQNKVKQFKYGADVTLQALSWLGVMARYDEVNYNLDSPGYLFSGVTGRVIFSSHFLSGESIYLQYSRYRYGDKMTLAGKWPWGTPLVQGNEILQGGPYAGQKPDMDVIKVQANVAF